jgi:hypothetical protein
MDQNLIDEITKMSEEVKTGSKVSIENIIISILSGIALINAKGRALIDILSENGINCDDLKMRAEQYIVEELKEILESSLK